MGAGAGWLDYNNDGWMDAILVNSGYTTPQFHPPTPRNRLSTAITRRHLHRRDSRDPEFVATAGFYFGVAIGGLRQRWLPGHIYDRLSPQRALPQQS